MKKFLGFVGILILGWANFAFCGTVTVSGTTTVFTAIQAGVDACPVGGTVSVSAGTYTEAVYINKRIALIGDGTPTIISGKVTTPNGTPTAGVWVNAVSNIGENGRYTDIAGNYTIEYLFPDVTYTITASCDTLEGFISSASILAKAGVTGLNFTLSIEYALGSIQGKIPGPSIPCLSPAQSNSDYRAELWQSGKKLLSVDVDSEGNFAIPNLASGFYQVKAYAGDALIGEKSVVLHKGESLEIKLGQENSKPAEEQVYLYPNPTTSDWINIHLYSTHPQPEPEIQIYTITGELVKTIEPAEIINKNTTTPPEYTYKWDLTNSQGKKVASGVYLCLIKVRNEQGEMVKVVKKLAVIR